MMLLNSSRAWLRATVPHLATWDDHDFGKNDGGSDLAGKQAAQQLFLRFWNIPLNDPRSSREGVYHAESFGHAGQRVQVILLDTRYFRSPLKITNQRGASGKERYVPDDDPSKTMLGDAQWTWLRDRLREPAEVRIVVSSIQVVSDGHGWERWGNLPLERRKLYQLIGETKAEGVVFVGRPTHRRHLPGDRRGAVPDARHHFVRPQQVFPDERGVRTQPHWRHIRETELQHDRHRLVVG
jgi:alkaline phosphatase D